MEPTTNVVLVHGAWADGSCWSKVIPLLQDKGLNVTAVQLALDSLENDIEVTRRALTALTGTTVLVGHSYGGAVITGAAKGIPGVAALVYITAFAVDEGESLDDLSKQGPQPPGAAHIQADEHGFLWIPPDAYVKVFAGDADPVEARVLAPTQRPLSIKSFTAKSGPAAWKHLPSWYLVCTNDQMIPPPAQEFMAKRIGATVRSGHASHASMISPPRDVFGIIDLAVESVAAPALAAAAGR